MLLKRSTPCWTYSGRTIFRALYLPRLWGPGKLGAHHRILLTNQRDSRLQCAIHLPATWKCAKLPGRFEARDSTRESGQVITHENQVTRGSGQDDPRTVFCWPACRTGASNWRFRRLKTFRLLSGSAPLGRMVATQKMLVLSLPDRHASEPDTCVALPTKHKKVPTTKPMEARLPPCFS